MNSLKKVTQKGFTIVELLIVIVVIGILAGLVVTTYNGIQQNARNKERVTDVKAIQNQLEAYYAENAKYPTLADLNTQPGTGNWWIQDNMKGLSKESLRDPKSTAANQYQLASAAPTAPGIYSYVPSPAACDNAAPATDCTSYVLTYFEEGGAAKPVNSLN